MNKIGYMGSLTGPGDAMAFGPPGMLNQGRPQLPGSVFASQHEYKTMQTHAVVSHWVPEDDHTTYTEGECIFVLAGDSEQTTKLFTPKSFNKYYAAHPRLANAAAVTFFLDLSDKLNFLGVCYSTDSTPISSDSTFKGARKIEIVVKGLAQTYNAWNTVNAGHSLRWYLDVDQDAFANGTLQPILEPYDCLKTAVPKNIKPLNAGNMLLKKSFEVGSFAATGNKNSKRESVYDPTVSTINAPMSSVILSGALFRR